MSDEPVDKPPESLSPVEQVDKAVEEIERATRALAAERIRRSFSVVQGGKVEPLIGSGCRVDREQKP